MTDPRFTDFATRLRARERATGYWVTLDSPVSTERVARLGYDYVVLDAQHGLLGYSGLLAGLTAIDAAGRAVGLVRVEANDPTSIGRALDTVAAVTVPLVGTAQDATDAVAAVRYPPHGRRSHGPLRAQLRIGPDPADTHEQAATAHLEAARKDSGAWARRVVRRPSPHLRPALGRPLDPARRRRRGSPPPVRRPRPAARRTAHADRRRGRARRRHGPAHRRGHGGRPAAEGGRRSAMPSEPRRKKRRSGG